MRGSKRSQANKFTCTARQCSTSATSEKKDSHPTPTECVRACVCVHAAIFLSLHKCQPSTVSYSKYYKTKDVLYLGSGMLG